MKIPRLTSRKASLSIEVSVKFDIFLTIFQLIVPKLPDTSTNSIISVCKNLKVPSNMGLESTLIYFLPLAFGYGNPIFGFRIKAEI